MNRQEIKAEAKKKISGNKWNILWPSLLIGFVLGLIESIFAPKVQLDFTNLKSLSDLNLPTSYYIVTIITSIISGLLMAGYLKYVINFVKTGKFDTKLILETIKKKWLNILIVDIVGGIIISVALMLFVIPGIIMALAYAFANFIVLDTDKSGIDSLKASREMMKGYKGDYLVFGLSFIGWILLVPFTLGILLIWLVPYMTVANIMYYEKLKAKK